MLVKGESYAFAGFNWGPELVTTEDGGPILEIIPNKKIVFIWQPDENPTTVTITLTRRREGTGSSDNGIPNTGV